MASPRKPLTAPTFCALPSAESGDCNNKIGDLSSSEFATCGWIERPVNRRPSHCSRRAPRRRPIDRQLNCSPDHGNTANDHAPALTHQETILKREQPRPDTANNVPSNRQLGEIDGSRLALRHNCESARIVDVGAPDHNYSTRDWLRCWLQHTRADLPQATFGIPEIPTLHFGDAWTLALIFG